MSRRFQVLTILRGVMVALAAVLVAACAATSGTTPSAPPSNDPAAFSTGRLTVVVSDQNGRFLDRARVDVAAGGAVYFRNAGLTDRTGRVTFTGVPEVVNVSVSVQGGAYAQNFLVPQSGTSEMRMIVQVFDTGEPPPVPRSAAR